MSAHRPHPTFAALTGLHTLVVIAFGCRDDELRLSLTPEGLVDLRLQRHHLTSTRSMLQRVGSFDDMQAWAQGLQAPRHKSRKGRKKAATASATNQIG